MHVNICACYHDAQVVCWTACRCGTKPAHALQHGFFPATAATSAAVTERGSHPPVWVCLNLLSFLELTQYETKSSAAIVAFSSALLHNHRRICPIPGQHGSINVLHLQRAQFERFLGICLRELRHAMLHVRKAVADVMHPANTAGAAVRGCPACSQGIDDSQLAAPDSRAPGAALPRPTCDGSYVTVSKVSLHLLAGSCVLPRTTHSCVLVAETLLTPAKSCLT